jgi:hypothetical protein
LVDRETLLGSDAAGVSRAFGPVSWMPPPPAPSAPSAPVAPPLPFRYFGKQYVDGHWQVFLAQGDVTQLVKEGETLNETYRVKRIAPPMMELVYLPLQQVQSLMID